MWWKILYRWAVGAGEVWYGLAPMMIWYGMVWYHTHKQTGPQLRKGMTPLRSSQAVEDELVLILAFAHCRRIPGSSCPAHSLSHHGQPAHTMGQPAHTMGQPAHTRSHHGCSHMGQPAHTWASPLTPWASPLTHGMGQPAHTPNNNSRRGCRLVSLRSATEIFSAMVQNKSGGTDANGQNRSHVWPVKNQALTTWAKNMIHIPKKKEAVHRRHSFI